MRKSFSCFIFLLTLLLVCKGENEGSGVFKIGFNVHRGNDKGSMSQDDQMVIHKRDEDGSVSVELRNMRTFYMADLLIGSNKDNVSVLLDTGSSDLWVMSHDLKCELSSSSSSLGNDVLFDVTEEQMEKDLVVEGKKEKKAASTPTLKSNVTKLADSEFYTTITYSFGGSDYPGFTTGAGGDGLWETTAFTGSTARTCTQYGSFNTGNSDTFRRNSSAPAFEIQYADNSNAIGTWGRDDVKIGNATVKSLSFAIANETTSNVGVLGIGLPGLEVTYANAASSSDMYQYENLPLKLKAQGTINKAAYSLYLGELDATTGTILFGAVDHAKYSGTLTTVPIINRYASVSSDPLRLEIALDSLAFDDDGSQVTVTSNKYSTLLDSGSTLSYLPLNLLDKLGEMLGGSWSSLIGTYIVDCTNDDSYSFVFNFSGKKIEVPYSNMLLKSGSTCFLGFIGQSSSSYILLGDNFLRSAYVVFDLEDHQISLAQIKYSSDEDIEIISSSIPSASSAQDYSSTSGIASSYSEGRATQTVSYSTGELTVSGANIGVGTISGLGSRPTSSGSSGSGGSNRNPASINSYSLYLVILAGGFAASIIL
ncbi:uncharacterized protein PRCAT00003083001 [Priceomyces carsonii]|uniref:uncharacterized protein n=1 Tax=Priceomyces carsonii TaxID=28549 RepID=UPI002EDA6B74|nr:unnamed protein product [Priceomyces carsonii]